MGITPKAVLVIAHSFMAFKDWGFFPHVAEEFAVRGYAVVTFNFSMNGVEGHGSKITDFARFAKNTFSTELSDLTFLLDAIAAGKLPGLASAPAKVVLLGHSRGGGIAILSAAREPRISALVTWASIASFDRWTDHQKRNWRANGLLPLARAATISPLALGIGLLEDVERNRKELDLLAAAGAVRVPWLIVHGEADLMVNVREADALQRASHGGKAELVRLEHVPHLFNAASESEDHYATIDGVIALTDRWLQRTFS